MGESDGEKEARETENERRKEGRTMEGGERIGRMGNSRKDGRMKKEDEEGE